MGDELSCSECGATADSIDDLEKSGEVTGLEVENDGSFNLFEKNDLFLCADCREPLGHSRSN